HAQGPHFAGVSREYLDLPISRLFRGNDSRRDLFATNIAKTSLQFHIIEFANLIGIPSEDKFVLAGGDHARRLTRLVPSHGQRVHRPTMSVESATPFVRFSVPNGNVPVVASGVHK